MRVDNYVFNDTLNLYNGPHLTVYLTFYIEQRTNSSL